MKFKNFISGIIFVLILSMPVFAETDAKLEYNKGVDYYKIGQYDKSMDAFRKAIDLDPEYIDAYYNLGSILEYLKQDEAALVVFKQIIVRKPTDYESVYKAALLAKKTGKYDKAKEFLSLIPSSSYVNSKAQQLAKELNTDLQTIKYNANNNEPQTQPQKNGVYENIPSPTGITTDNNGNLYVAGYSDNVIYKITPNGEKIVFVKDKKLNGPIGLIYNGGNLYVANYNANNVLKIDKNGVLTIKVNNVMQPYGLHISNGTLFVSSQGSNAIIRVKL